MSERTITELQCDHRSPGPCLVAFRLDGVRPDIRAVAAETGWGVAADGGDLCWWHAHAARSAKETDPEFRCTCGPNPPDVAECMACGMADCPEGEPLHYHHDGCPACDVEDRLLSAFDAKETEDG